MFKPSVRVPAATVTGATLLNSGTAGNFQAWVRPDAAFSDSLSGSTPFTSNPDVQEVAQGPVGVIDFYWVKGKGKDKYK